MLVICRAMADRPIGPSLILKIFLPDRDDVLDAPPFADQARSSDWPVLKTATRLELLPSVRRQGHRGARRFVG